MAKPGENKTQSKLQRYETPYRLHLETTNKCNLHCIHCYRSSSIDNKHFDLQTLVDVFNVCKKYDLHNVTLTGGEIFTRPDWKKIVSESLNLCDNLYILTNGTLLSRKKLNWLAFQKVYHTIKQTIKFLKFGSVDIGLGISLDGLRGNAVVRRTKNDKRIEANEILEKIRLATSFGLLITVNTTISNMTSAQELVEMYNILKTCNIDRWQIDIAFKEGRFADNLGNQNLEWLNQAKRSFVEILRNYIRDCERKEAAFRMDIVQVFRHDILQKGFISIDTLGHHPCEYQFGSIIVEEGNQYRFCPSLRNSYLGMLNSDTNLYRTISKDESGFFNKTIRDLPCMSCRYARLFHGGCRANSLSYRRAIWDFDPICCLLAPFVEKEVIPILPDSLRENFNRGLRDGRKGFLL